MDKNKWKTSIYIIRKTKHINVLASVLTKVVKGIAINVGQTFGRCFYLFRNIHNAKILIFTIK